MPLAILTYHSLDPSGSVLSVAPETFADQMAGLAAAGVRAITLREAVAHRQSAGVWPERSVVLTFDDGYANTYDLAVPSLQRHGFRATVFLVTGSIGRQRMLSWEQAAELAAAGLEIGAHTCTHPDLRRLPAHDLEKEIVGARDTLEDRLQCHVDSFAYPFGWLTPAAERIVQRAFGAACTTVLKRADAEPLHRLPRVDMYYIRSPSALRRLVAGQLDSYLSLRRWGRVLRRVGS